MLQDLHVIRLHAMSVLRGRRAVRHWRRPLLGVHPRLVWLPQVLELRRPQELVVVVWLSYNPIEIGL